MISWLITKIVGGAVLVGGVFVGLFFAKRNAVHNDRVKTRLKDMENAENIRDRARDVDKRVRDFDDAGFRD